MPLIGRSPVRHRQLDQQTSTRERELQDHIQEKDLQVLSLAKLVLGQLDWL